MPFLTASYAAIVTSCIILFLSWQGGRSEPLYEAIFMGAITCIIAFIYCFLYYNKKINKMLIIVGTIFVTLCIIFYIENIYLLDIVPTGKEFTGAMSFIVGLVYWFMPQNRKLNRTLIILGTALVTSCFLFFPQSMAYTAETIKTAILIATIATGAIAFITGLVYWLASLNKQLKKSLIILATFFITPCFLFFLSWLSYIF